MDELATWVNGFIAVERTPERVAGWVGRTQAAIEADNPQIAESADLTPLVRAAIEEHWLAFLDHLEHGATFRLASSAAELAHELARRHLDLTLLLGIYRSAQRASWTYATDVVSEAPATLDHEALLVLFWSEAATWLDASVEESLLLHQHEARRIQQRGDAQRFEAVQSVLAGEDRDPRERLSAALGGYPVGGSHVALVLSALTPDALTALEPTAHKLATRLGSRQTLLVRPSGREIWGWVPVDKVADLDPHDLDPTQLRVTIGGPHHGIDGFVLAHREARAALPVALARSESLTTYDDVAGLTMLAADPEVAARFTRRVLGPLAEPAQAPLRHTVRVALTTTGGAEAVAEALGVHKNTVRYRIGQAERMLGHPLQTRLGDLLLALDYADTFLP